MNKTVCVLGTNYIVKEDSPVDNQKLAAAGDGYCDTSEKIIVIDSMKEKDPLNKGNLEEYKKTVTRHEIVHAFLYESGLDACCEWARSEEMVDWVAIQCPKLLQAFSGAGAM